MGKDACVCVCVHICIRSIPPVSPEIKQRLSPLQCTKSSCGSDTWIKQATSMSSPKSFSEPLHLSGFWEASRGETRITKRHPISLTWPKGSASDSPAKPTSKPQSCYWAFFFPQALQWPEIPFLGAAVLLAKSQSSHQTPRLWRKWAVPSQGCFSRRHLCLAYGNYLL